MVQQSYREKLFIAFKVQNSENFMGMTSMEIDIIQLLKSSMEKKLLDWLSKVNFFNSKNAKYKR